MASQNLVHRDLAACNVLVGNDKIIKISDFGLTGKLSEDLIYIGKTDRKQPLKWMSLEAIINEEFTMFSDVLVDFCKFNFKEAATEGVL